MRTLRYDAPSFATDLEQALQTSSLFDPAVEQRTREVIDQVQAHGDEALVELAKRFDGVDLTPDQLRLTVIPRPPSTALRAAIAAALVNVQAFANRSLRSDWQRRNQQGGVVGEKFDPLQRVGVYIPGGTAPLVSTAVMTVGLAKVAGCREIVVCTPPTRELNHQLLYAIRTAGATEVYRVGGAQAIAALALGTRTIRRVTKIFGPGNAYVTAAKRLLFGRVGIDLLSGPSELLVIADRTANPVFIAADLLAQAEHGSGHERVWLVSTSQPIITETAAEIQRQLPALQRSEFVRQAIAHNGVCVLVKNATQAVHLTNRFAPEHLEIMTANPRAVAKRILTAGAIFLGPWSPTVVGDYLAGPSHELPTGGAGAFFGGLTVDQFQRRTSVVELSRAALEKSLPALETFGQVEGLDAHVASARVRFR